MMVPLAAQTSIPSKMLLSSLLVQYSPIESSNSFPSNYKCQLYINALCDEDYRTKLNYLYCQIYLQDIKKDLI